MSAMGLSNRGRWRELFFYREERLRTTWLFRVVALLTGSLVLWATLDYWSAAIATDLVCEANDERSDAILVENFDPIYLVFARAAALRRSGMAERIIVPLSAATEDGVNKVDRGVAEVMASVARLGPFEPVAIREVEPISLNAARDIAQYLQQSQIRSVTVVTPLFRSKRSMLVYSHAFGDLGISVRCVPVEATHTVENWWDTWHGRQNVTEQWAKLQYYRFYVMPFIADPPFTR